MSKGVERHGDKATCGHPNSGSNNVFVNGRGCTRIKKDSAGGTIIGPGIPSVIVNGFPISVVNDNIQSHGIGIHGGPKTANPSTNVIAGG